ncbi:MAG TPA: glycosyltransferase family 1 protein [Polyangiaceae bacterium]|nr:glycosyltransferase family 1 protein [Polyangiaceae bacterium]
MENYDIVCLSHLRWSFVFQRPQHLLSRCALERRVFFVEEPIFSAEHCGPARLEATTSSEGVVVVVAHFADGISPEEVDHTYGQLLREYLAREDVSDYVLWYYTPMALPLAEQLAPLAVVYDCMDQLSAFKNAPPLLTRRERELFARADVVFTGGHALYEAKKQQHPNVHAFPSSVDVPHFAKARVPQLDPEDQRNIPGPRLGFFGVIDERMDLELLTRVAAARPYWQLVMLGPVVKIDPADLPNAPNIHYLGGKSYAELPAYIAGWDVALLPFARNESTQFISPTKTPEYLAAGKPVVSTSIRDVVRPYQRLGLVRIADAAEAFVSACEEAMCEPVGQRLLKADAYLSHLSWDRTWREMRTRMEQAIERRSMKSAPQLRVAESSDEALLDVALGGE